MIVCQSDTKMNLKKLNQQKYWAELSMKFTSVGVILTFISIG